MTKTGFTFTNLAEAEEAWETMRQYLFLGSKLNVFTGKDALAKALETMEMLEEGNNG